MKNIEKPRRRGVVTFVYNSQTEALKVVDYLSSKDVLWGPVQEYAEPAIPSFHAYIRRRARRRENELERGFRDPTPDRDDGNDGLER